MKDLREVFRAYSRSELRQGAELAGEKAEALKPLRDHCLATGDVAGAASVSAAICRQRLEGGCAAAELKMRRTAKAVAVAKA